MTPVSYEHTIQLARQQYAAGHFEQCILLCNQVLQARPSLTDAVVLLGQSLLESRRPNEAEEKLRLALAQRANAPDLLSDLGTALRFQIRLDEAILAYRSAIELAPDYALAHFNLGLALLEKGDLREGFAQIEWRWRIPGLKIFHQDFSQPRWDGRPLNGRRILLREEQGFGDTIQFARYVERVSQQAGGRVILACRPELLRLFRTLRGVQQYLTHGDSLVPFDVHATLMDLPARFGTTIETIPASVPYLAADPELVSRWKSEIGNADGKVTVGLVWAGASRYPGDSERSITFDMLSPLVDVANVQFFSLQKTKDQGNLNLRSRISGSKPVSPSSFILPPSSLELIDHVDQLHDFADTAALIQNLDLIITVDTAVAHLAGAMGRPAWVLIPYAPDWRWMLNRTDSPWYPSMRLFRQPVAGDWRTVIERVAQELSRWRK